MPTIDEPTEQTDASYCNDSYWTEINRTIIKAHLSGKCTISHYDSSGNDGYGRPTDPPYSEREDDSAVIEELVISEPMECSYSDEDTDWNKAGWQDANGEEIAPPWFAEHVLADARAEILERAED